MRTLFHYNWMVREEWFSWCEDITEEELLCNRVGGVGGILRTLFHIIDVEWSWIRCLQGKSDFQENFDDYQSIERILELQTAFRPEVVQFVNAWDESMENNTYYDSRSDGTVVTDAWGEVMRHVIAHEIHHIGQLSVWSRELGRQPISANVIGRNLIHKLPGLKNSGD